MNNGRFFRLNQSISKVNDGVAIYDYVDLPAYFGPSEDNLMSPKYPVSVTITSNSVRFRLHYSVYKVEEESIYGYSVEEIREKNGGTTKGMNMAHMEEVIFELPYRNDATDKLTETIKELYYTKFPLKITSDDNKQDGSSGGRFLEQLIRSRFPLEDNTQGGIIINRIKQGLYESLQDAVDILHSYSTLWLMNLTKTNGKSIYLYEEEDKRKDIVGFLRKLLLDFMFDLKHSDVFQNSRYYDQMYSGLMSNFYFSALMHKCEYYYYRKLTREAIDEIEQRKDNVSEDEIEQRKESIKVLYANELVKAEDLWVQDIMNPQAEKDFEYDRNLWFSEPEEEMRRVCFTMKEKDSGKKHICNTDTLIEYFKINNSKDNISVSLVATNDRNRELISRWFLKRYDFNDVIHLHFFKGLNFIIVSCIVFILLFWLLRLIDLNVLNDLNETFSDNIIYFVTIGIVAIICPPTIYSIWNNASKEDLIIRKRRATVFKRTYIIFSFLSFYAICIGVFNTVIGKEWGEWGEWAPIWFFFILSALFYISIKTPKLGLPALHPISSLHLLFPRLVAAITAGWLTMSLGFDIYVSFFDSSPRWHTAIAISMVVFMFIMYEINRIMPASNNLRKIFRGVEFLIISYCISLLVGVVVINFLGEKFLERGSYIGDYYDQHVQQDVNGKSYIVDTIAYCSNSNEEILNDSQWVSYGKAIINRLNDINDPNDIPDIKKVDNLREATKDGHKIVEKITIFGYKIFFMRDFLIMFSFIAMFWGIFIQMIFTGEKQMTEL